MRMKTYLSAAGMLAAFLMGGLDSRASAQAAPCVPVDGRPAEAPDYQPAFAGQTRACRVQSNVAYDVTVVATGLERPWSLEPLPGGGFLVTEKAGRMRHVSAAGAVSAPITGVPPVVATGQAGLLDIALSPSFATDRMVYWSFSEPREGGSGTSVARGVLSADATRLDRVQVILRTRPTYTYTNHYGSRLAFGPDGFLYVTMGDRFTLEARVQALQLDSHLGKTLRIRPDGTPAPGNPFASRAGALPEIWTYGHRNVQGSAFDPQGRFWTIEHGPRGGDELNLALAGRNFGWPTATYGIDYSGQRMANNEPHRAGVEQPVYYWSPVIAPGGMQFYTGNAFPAWRGNLFVGGMAAMRLVRLVIENDRVVGEEHLLADRQQRIRDVRQGPDGALYVVTEPSRDANAIGELLRIAPRGAQASTAAPASAPQAGTAQQPAPPQQQPYVAGQPLGITTAGAFAPISSNVKVHGAIYSAESCSYDADRGLIVVPSRGPLGTAQANDAWVSFLNHDGSVHTPRWIGVQNAAQRANLTPALVLNEPFGSDIARGMLYLADRDAGATATDPSVAVIRRFDMRTGAPAGEVRVERVAWFNDIEVADDGTIYATVTGALGANGDPSTWQLWRIASDGTSSMLVQGAPLRAPNGVAFDPQGNVVVANAGDDAVLTFSPAGQLLSTERAAQAGSDGLVIMPDGTKYISSVFQGGVSRIRPGQAAELIAQNIPQRRRCATTRALISS